MSETFAPNPKFNPEFQSVISPKTKLGRGISMAKFLSGNDRQQSVNHLSQDELRKLAKQYTMHARILDQFKIDRSFPRHRLIVAEGYYRKQSGENFDANSVNYFLNNGQAVVYEVIGLDGEVDLEVTFDVAVQFINTLKFKKLILSYDTFNPDTSLSAQIIIIMPRIVDPWTVLYDQEYETRFNNFVQTTNELVECKGYYVDGQSIY